MTRKDYDLIANALHTVYPGCNADYQRSLQFSFVVKVIATALAGDNPHFDAEQFRVACGLGRSLLARE